MSSSVTQLLEYQKTIQNNLIQLASLERTINERIVAQGGSSTMAVYLKEIKDSKEKLFLSLKNIYVVTQDITEGSVNDYKNILAVKTCVQKSNC